MNGLEYRKLIESEPEIQEALSIASANAIGKYWLIGGVVYRRINQHLHNVPVKSALKDIPDIDILFQALRHNLFLGDYELTFNSSGEPCLKKEGSQVELIRLDNVIYIVKNSLESNTENYFAGCFTDVQSIAFDVLENKLLGPGIGALEKRRIRVANVKELESYCKRKGINSEEYLRRLAGSLNMPLA